MRQPLHIVSRRAGMAAAIFLAAGAPAAVVSFSQVDWRNNSGGFTAFQSEWGLARVQLDGSDLANFASVPGGYLAYVNATATVPAGVNDSWQIANRPIFVRNTFDAPFAASYDFFLDLGITRGSARVSSLDFRFELSPTPAVSAPAGPTTPSAVDAKPLLFGGRDLSSTTGNSGNTGTTPPSAPVYNPLNQLSGPDLRYGGVSDTKKIPAVNENDNHCAPGSVTRSLGYLDATNDSFGISQTTQQIVDSLAQSMKTSLTDGTTDANILSGKDEFLRNNGVPVETFVTTDISVVIECLNDGADVEALIDYGKDAQGRKKGGHATMVSEVVASYDAMGNLQNYIVRTVDDPDQGDGMAENSYRDYEANFNNNIAGYYIGSKFDGFIVEKVVPEPAGVALAPLALLAGRRRRV
jgi:hypothetical protein